MSSVALSFVYWKEIVFGRDEVVMGGRKDSSVCFQ